jgi:ABC-type multidrug transport system, permease component
MPVVQLLVLIHAVTFDVKSLNLAVVDNSRSSDSRELISKFVGSSFFLLKDYPQSSKQAMGLINSGKADLALVIPEDFSLNQVRDGKVNVQLLINSINTTQATLANAYASSIIADYNRAKLPPGAIESIYTADIRPRFWFNPTLDFKIYMFPGIMVVLVTAIGLFLSGMNLVREKEIGTIEQLNVTPIKKWQFVVGKVLPFLFIGLFEICLGILIGRIAFGIPFVGSVGTLLLATFVYLLVVIAIGTLISNESSTQQQSMFVSWFFMMLFLMMSGLFNIVESMPQWAIWINKINPISYFILIIRMVMLKGATISDIALPLGSLAIYAVVAMTLAITLYQKKTA